jgi:hypothetical protein
VANRRGTITVRVFSNHTVPAHPRWADVEPILKQFARLYPSMTAVMDLSQHSVAQSMRAAVLAAIQRAKTNPRYMPVTRDLSRDKEQLLVRWINQGAPA